MKFLKGIGRVASNVNAQAGGVASILALVELKFGYFQEHLFYFLLFLLGAAATGVSLGRRWPGTGAGQPSNSPHPEIRVLRDNDEMADAVKHIVKLHRDSIAKVTVIQYSGVNIVSTLKPFEKTLARIEVYLVNPARAGAINDHQKTRAAGGPKHLDNELVKYHIAGLEKFIYDAPGSIRAVLIDDHVLYVGAYQYEVATMLGSVLDIRGGEMPLFEVPCGHPAFPVLARAIQDMVTNWKHERNADGQFTATRYSRETAHA